MGKPNKNRGQLKLRSIAIDTYRENVAYLNRECETYRAEGFQALSKIEISANGNTMLKMWSMMTISSPRVSWACQNKPLRKY